MREETSRSRAAPGWHTQDVGEAWAMIANEGLFYEQSKEARMTWTARYCAGNAS
ncbi:MAG TPA: hypothetical protein VF544_03285 [Pyrinomonadaceae bacterium]